MFLPTLQGVARTAPFRRVPEQIGTDPLGGNIPPVSVCASGLVNLPRVAKPSVSNKHTTVVEITRGGNTTCRNTFSYWFIHTRCL